MNELALFAGRGGGLLASKLLGWNTVCAVEYDKGHRDCLLQRQRDGVLERFPIWDDIRTFDGKPWRGKINVLSGGFPCQGISSAGEGKGLADERSGLWSEYKRLIGEIGPDIVFAENSPLLRTRGLGQILEDLASLGYDAGWGDLGACQFGAHQRRERKWIVAKPIGSQWGEESHSREARRVGRLFKSVSWNTSSLVACASFRGVDDGLARDVGRTDGIRNGQVPVVAANAFRILS